MKFLALVSGGKDSIYSIQECVRNGHELVACVHLGAPVSVEEESFMYQTAASEVLPVENREKISGARSWADAVTEGRSSQSDRSFS